MYKLLHEPYRHTILIKRGLSIRFLLPFWVKLKYNYNNNDNNKYKLENAYYMTKFHSYLTSSTSTLTFFFVFGPTLFDCLFGGKCAVYISIQHSQSTLIIKLRSLFYFSLILLLFRFPSFSLYLREKKKMKLKNLKKKILKKYRVLLFN